MTELTPKQVMFCKEYIVDLNGTQAAIRAGYSEKTAAEQSSRLLTNVRIQSYVQSLLNKRIKKVELTAEDVLLDILDTRKTAKEQDKLNERIKCNELLGKHLKMFTDKLDVGGQEDNPIEISVKHKLLSTLTEEQLEALDED